MKALRFPKGQGLIALPWDIFVAHLINVIWFLVLVAAAKTALDDEHQIAIGHLQGLVMPILLILFAWAIRMILLASLEFGFIHRLLLEDQYREWSATFAASEPNPRNVSRPFTIQYKPQWILVPILLLGSVLILIGFVTQPMFFARFLGIALVTETAIRVSAETIWCRSHWIRTKFAQLCFRFLPPRLRHPLRKYAPHAKMDRARV